jgi:ABC-2 type transport system permease protein
MALRLKDSAFFKVLQRETTRISKSKIIIFMSLLGPLLSFIVVMNIFTTGIPSSLPVVVVDEDNSGMSRQMVRMVDATRIASITERAANLSDAQNIMLKGQAEAVIYIPREFEKHVLKGESSDIVLYINNTNVLKGGLLQSGIYKVASTFSTGVKLQVAMKQGQAQSQALEQVYAVRLDSHVLFNPYTNYSYFLVTALMPLLIVVFSLLGAIYAMGMEIREGTSKQWLQTAQNSIIVAISGKLMPYLFFMLINTAVMNFILVHHLGFPMKGYWGAIMLSQLLLIVSYQMVAVILLALTGNTRLSLSLGSAYSMMALTFSGLTFPVAGMPVFSQFLARLFPFFHWMRVFIGQALRDSPLVETVIPMSAMLLFVIVGFALMPQLKKVLLSDAHQYKI